MPIGNPLLLHSTIMASHCIDLWIVWAAEGSTCVVGLFSTVVDNFFSLIPCISPDPSTAERHNDNKSQESLLRSSLEWISLGNISFIILLNRTCFTDSRPRVHHELLKVWIIRPFGLTVVSKSSAIRSSLRRFYNSHNSRVLLIFPEEAQLFVTILVSNHRSYGEIAADMEMVTAAVMWLVVEGLEFAGASTFSNPSNFLYITGVRIDQTTTLVTNNILIFILYFRLPWQWTLVSRGLSTPA